MGQVESDVLAAAGLIDETAGGERWKSTGDISEDFLLEKISTEESVLIGELHVHATGRLIVVEHSRRKTGQRAFFHISGDTINGDRNSLKVGEGWISDLHC